MMGFLGDFGYRAGNSALAEERRIPLGSHPYEPFMASESIANTRRILWVPVRDLFDFDYDAKFGGTFPNFEEKQGNLPLHREDAKAATEMTFRRFFPPCFFSELDRRAASDADRIVIFFAEKKRGSSGR